MKVTFILKIFADMTISDTASEIEETTKTIKKTVFFII